MAKRTGKELAEKLRDLTLKIYKTAADYAAGRGIIIADTKFEFGQTSQGLILADEVLTPDSSRFWPANKYQPGKAQESFDKQFVRDYLEAIKWNKQPPLRHCRKMLRGRRAKNTLRHTGFWQGVSCPQVETPMA